jgi:hypothetical protein
MLRNCWLYIIWAFLIAFWAFSLLPGVEDPFPLHAEHRAAAVFSPWRQVGSDSTTGEPVFMHEGTLDLVFHTAYFTEEKRGADGQIRLGNSVLRLRPWRFLIWVSITFAAIGLLTYVWNKRNPIYQANFGKGGRGFDVIADRK